LKFTESGAIKFGYIVNHKRNIEFFVSDTGIGLSENEQQVIFDRFRQVSSSYNKVYGGTGLGLSISKGLAEKLGGRIWVESELEKGSTFYFSIPYKPGIQMDYQEEIDYTLEFNWQGKTILVAEDEDVNYNLIETVLSPTAAKIIRAKTGIEAIERMEEDIYIDLVLMDIKMPDMNGFEATKRIKQMRKNVPIIAQTAYAMSTDEENCIRSGCDDYISKPLRIDTLLKKIDKHVRQKEVVISKSKKTSNVSSNA
jgi:CheY-like chemotaxis protein